jgi:hypothetical protein
MVGALYKEPEVLAHGRSCVGGDLREEGCPVRPCNAIPVLLPDGAVAATHKGVDGFTPST